MRRAVRISVCPVKFKPYRSVVIEVRLVNSTFEREPLSRPFGFKGGYLSELWQVITLLEGASGARSVGLGTQSVLWSDPAVFAGHSEAGGNALMYAVLEFASQLARTVPFETPIDLLEEIYPSACAYAKTITQRPDLRATFVLNALVSLDNAAWLLYAKETGIESFDDLIPEPYRPALSHRHSLLASIPAVGFGSTDDELRSLADAGYFVIKVKLGHPGSQDDMLAQDKLRMEQIHRLFGGRETAHTASGRIPYYLDLNGRYDSIDRLHALIDHADAIGALDHILVVEEPFPEGYEADVSQVGVRLAADEGAHTDADARRLLDMGYGAIALKPVAKTVSMTLKIAAEAHRRNIPCFCADLTVNPILVDWNKSFAARLTPFPGLDFGLLETNGHQNYRNWDRMVSYHPFAGASWMRVDDGVFRLNDDFYKHSGGIFELSRHYLDEVLPNGT